MVSGQTTTDTKHLNKAAQRIYAKQNVPPQDGIEDELITKFLPMVYKIARQVVTYIKPPLSFEDMVSAGTVGLVMAARDFKPSYGAEFQTYAYIRIKGAILDELRGWSFVPANLHKKIQNIRQVSRKIMEQTGVTPTDEELAEKIGIPVEELYGMLEAARAQHFASLDYADENSPALGKYLTMEPVCPPDRQTERDELVDILAETIQQLPQKSRQVILLYYTQELTMKQIAEVLDITESRVSQLHASALFNMSIKLRQWKDE